MPAAALRSPPHARMKDPFTGPFKREGEEARERGFLGGVKEGLVFFVYDLEHQNVLGLVVFF